jgi:hypothetical protein
MELEAVPVTISLRDQQPPESCARLSDIVLCFLPSFLMPLGQAFVAAKEPLPQLSRLLGI